MYEMKAKKLIQVGVDNSPQPVMLGLTAIEFKYITHHTESFGPSRQMSQMYTASFILHYNELFSETHCNCLNI